MAQHDGLPIRLMDWTYSPFGAPHFGTANIEQSDRDGAIRGANDLRTHELVPERPAEWLAREGANVFSFEMLSETVTSEQELDALCPRPCALFFEPPSINAGIVNQFAFLSVTSDPKGTVEHRLAEHPGLAPQIVIPAGLEREIRDELDQPSVTERRPCLRLGG